MKCRNQFHTFRHINRLRFTHMLFYILNLFDVVIRQINNSWIYRLRKLSQIIIRVKIIGMAINFFPFWVVSPIRVYTWRNRSKICSHLRNTVLIVSIVIHFHQWQVTVSSVTDRRQCNCWVYWNRREITFEWLLVSLLAPPSVKFIVLNWAVYYRIRYISWDIDCPLRIIHCWV